MEKRFRRYVAEALSPIVADALAERAFSACSIGYLWRENGHMFYDVHAYGTTEESGQGVVANEDTFYDLASLTKPLVTALATMVLVDEQQVELNEKIASLYPEAGPGISGVSPAMLLSHSSGLPAHRPYHRLLEGYPPKERRRLVSLLIGREGLVYPPGEGCLYSDLGYILLGLIIERVTGRSLADFWGERIAAPLGLNRLLLFPGLNTLPAERCAATRCLTTGEKLCGTVHDDNCRALGGIAGHAGLFGTIQGVISLAGHLMRLYHGECGKQAISGKTLRRFLTRRPGSTWCCGFDSPTPGASSSGRFFSRNSVGHLGFTGTSLWIDLEAGVAVVLLTNRILMSENPAQIRRLRPLLHDAVMRDILEGRNPDRTFDGRPGQDE